MRENGDFLGISGFFQRAPTNFCKKSLNLDTSKCNSSRLKTPMPADSQGPAVGF
jgi:hypothetical protein